MGHRPFRLHAGRRPTFVADQEEANYLENYHAVSDTYDKVDFRNSRSMWPKPLS